VASFVAEVGGGEHTLTRVLERACSLIGCADETPIPLEGGYGGHPNITQEVYASLAAARLSAAAPIMQSVFSLASPQVEREVRKSRSATLS
jgi:hypothetical protein